MKRGSIMPWVFTVALLIVSAIASLPALAELRFTVGQPLHHMLDLCLDKADAIEILTVHEKEGFEKAKEVWEKKEKCNTLPVSGPKVGNVVFSIRFDGKEVKVVEIVGDEVLGYFLTSAPVDAKRDRDA